MVHHDTNSNSNKMMTRQQQQQQRPRISNIPGLVCAFSASVTTGGTIYAFGIYGDALKRSLQLTQLELNVISSTFFVAGLFSWIPGMVVDRRGTRFSLIMGGVSGALSVMTYWAVARQFVVVSYVMAVLSTLAVCICLSCALIVGSIFKLTLLCGGPHSTGAAVGVAKGFVGLGSGVYACIFQALRTQSESAIDFLPVIASFFLICASTPALLLLPTKQQAAISAIQYETGPHHFRTMYLSLFVLFLVIIGSSVGDLLKEHDRTASPQKRDYWKVALILVVWLGPITSLLYLPRQQQEDRPILSQETTKEDTEENATTSQQQQQQQEAKPLVESYQNSSPTAPVVAETIVEQPVNLNLAQMLQTPSAWLMLWVTTILVGSGTYKTNNMGEMVDSLGFPDAVTPAALALFSVAQALARVVTGVFSEATLHWKVDSCCIDHGVPRPFYLVVASATAALTHFMLALSTGQVWFVIWCTLSGLSFGMAWPLMVLIVGEIFGVEHHGANYMFYDGFTKAVGTIFLSEFVAGNVYENNVDPDDPLTCHGPACFQKTHFIVAGMALTCVAASLALQFISRNVYYSISSSGRNQR